MRITNSCDVKPGLVMYHVYGCDRTNTVINELDISVYTVLSMPEPHTGAYSDVKLGDFIKVNIQYYADDGLRTYNSESSLNDMGILDGKRAYNLNRVFTTKAEALLFMAELQNNTFSYPDDIEFSAKDTHFDSTKWSMESNFF